MCLPRPLGEVEVLGGAALADPTGDRALCSEHYSEPNSARSAALGMAFSRLVVNLGRSWATHNYYFRLRHAPASPIRLVANRIIVDGSGTKPTNSAGVNAESLMRI